VWIRDRKKEDPNFEDDGLLLISAYDDEHDIGVVRLYDIKEEKVLWTWVPNLDAIDEMYLNTGDKNPKSNTISQIKRGSFNTKHPYLLEDGHLLVTASGKLAAKLDPQGKPVWMLKGTYHHSIERMANGNIVLVKDMKNSGVDFRNDGYVIVSPDGEILEERTLMDIFKSNGYSGHFHRLHDWSTFRMYQAADPFHLNDAEPMHETDEFVQEGDIAMSLAHPSMVFLYRPSEDKIIWLKAGPWSFQHDVDYQGNGVFSIFDNNRKDHLPQDLTNGDYSGIYLYNMATDSFERPLKDIFDQNQLYTKNQGLHRMLENGDIFVEMQNMNQLMRLGPDGIRWRYAQGLSQPGTVGNLQWSRYLNRDEVDLSWIDAQKK